MFAQNPQSKEYRHLVIYFNILISKKKFHETYWQCTLYWDSAQFTVCSSTMDQNMPLLSLLMGNVEILFTFISFGGCEGYHLPFKQQFN